MLVRYCFTVRYLRCTRFPRSAMRTRFRHRGRLKTVADSYVNYSLGSFRGYMARDGTTYNRNVESHHDSPNYIISVYV